jgi:protein-S-isoprenylcysteine O-methyltransferase
MDDLLDSYRKCAKHILIFMGVSFALGLISDLSYLYPGIHILKFGLIIGIALLVTVTVIETSVIDNKDFEFGKLISFNLTTYIFGIIAYYALRNLYGRYFPQLYGLSYFALAQIIYYLSEFIFVCVCHTKDLKWESFLINQSRQYEIAMIACMIEFYLEFRFNIMAKSNKDLRSVGLVVIAIGMFLRIGAFISAGQNFTHAIREHKEPDHILITSGVYRISRHPSYIGWFLFTIGSQILLCNPICLIAFTLESWKFFYERIKYEEITLVKLFGEEFERYRQKTPILIPFIDYFIKQSKNE